MCLELFNSLLGLHFAWLGLALCATIVAILVARWMMTFPKKGSTDRESPGFTCPCYAPPQSPPEQEAE
jgi:hypothetical protein